jgi:subtilisin family serine protease
MVYDSSTVISAANYFRSKGGVVATSAGNTGAVNSAAATSSMFVVAATDAKDARASFSTFGPGVNIAAPGVGIYTTANGGGYRSASGTSLASPIVAGAAAQRLSARAEARGELGFVAAGLLPDENVARRVGGLPSCRTHSLHRDACARAQRRYTNPSKPTIEGRGAATRVRSVDRGTPRDGDDNFPSLTIPPSWDKRVR